MLVIASVHYWINLAHTAKYKIKPHAIAINTNQIAIFPNLGICPYGLCPNFFLRKDDHHP